MIVPVSMEVTVRLAGRPHLRLVHLIRSDGFASDVVDSSMQVLKELEHVTRDVVLQHRHCTISERFSRVSRGFPMQSIPAALTSIVIAEVPA